MGVFGNLMAKIMGHEARASEAKVNTAVASNAPAAGAPASPAAVPAASAPAQPVDVEAVLQGMATSNSQKLDWRNSIVDLMKLVGIDSGLEARKSMAKELGYTGSTDDSATMNIWLHKEVMRQLAANGGNVPANLLS
ncbi:MAG: DUF3597 domain-containing protein [Gemmatimonadota bacterium]|nr:DUF3597 domain-containing protein [Gemmatimonadota bacterium]